MSKKEVYIQFVCDEWTSERAPEVIANLLWEMYDIDNVSVKIEELSEFAERS